MSDYFKLSHYHPHSILTSTLTCIQHLKFTKFLLENIVEAIEQFYFKKNYNQFDAHVGDALCQIRAIKLLELTLYEMPHIENYIECIEKLIEKTNTFIYELNNKETEEKRKFKHTTLEKFLLNLNIFFELPDNIEFLVKCYLLNYYKQQPDKANTFIDIKKLQKETNNSRKFSENFIRNLQISLSELSTNYIISISDYSNELVQYLIKQDSLNRKVLPCYFLTKIILKRLKHLKLNIFISIRTSNVKNNTIFVSLPFNYKPEQDKYSFIQENFIADSPCCIFYCYSDILSLNNILSYKNDIIDLGPENLFLYVTAEHVQYSPVNLHQFNKCIYLNLLNNIRTLDNSELTDQANRLLVEYEHDRMKYTDKLRSDFLFRCQIEHVSIGTKALNKKVYANLGFCELFN